MAQITCWEVLECGKEDTCPAHPNHGCDCWNVTGTLCCGDQRAAYSDKVGHCREQCKYYNGVILGSIKLA